MGDMDPFVLPFIMKKKGITLEKALEECSKKGGLAGLSGISADMREINAAIEGANEKIGDLNASKNLILATPANMRTAIQTKALGRYNEYIGEVNDQIGRLETAMGCLN